MIFCYKAFLNKTKNKKSLDVTPKKQIFDDEAHPKTRVIWSLDKTSESIEFIKVL